ncbi:hypothetical protein L2E82_15603 [Cichorium intybus]|uniref:Uncharacterized protein n=1 Tax=Cichorium intybus TaxID=13427 RepID=A0ACB9F3N6_CICIN|nr:hypothetical protein L2E82_15603 [Cichorium intybus]
MVRAPYFDKNGMEKGAWSEDEDAKLKAYMKKTRHGNWRQLPKLAGLSRCGKSCRLRWVNYLRPNVKRGNYTSEEEDLIINLHKNHGSRWSKIAAKLPGRSDNEIKNHWHTHLRKRAKHNSILSCSTNQNVQNVEPKKEKGEINLSHMNEKYEAEIILTVLRSKTLSEANNKQPPLSSSSGSYHMASNSNPLPLSTNESFEDFWTKPYLPDTFSSTSDEYSYYEFSTLSVNLLNKYVSSSYDLDTIMVDAYLWSVMEFYAFI